MHNAYSVDNVLINNKIFAVAGPSQCQDGITDNCTQIENECIRSCHPGFVMSTIPGQCVGG